MGDHCHLPSTSEEARGDSVKQEEPVDELQENEYPYPRSQTAYPGVPLKGGRKEHVDLARRFRKKYLMTLSSSWKNVCALSVIPSLREWAERAGGTRQCGGAPA